MNKPEENDLMTEPADKKNIMKSAKDFMNGVLSPLKGKDIGQLVEDFTAEMTLVAEGVGDHGCEYMTGGCVVVLGPTGKNFAAGMSGGTAYVLDEQHELYRKLNKELVSMTAVTEKHDVAELKALIERHVAQTGSPRGATVLQNWEETLPLFKKILPNDYRRMLSAILQLEEKGVPRAQAELEAFNELQQGER